MNKTWLYASLLFIMCLSCTIERAYSQTRRVNIGKNASGTYCYLEVFEYDYVTDKPSFPGGDANLIEFINENREYPKEAYRKGIQGRVTCSFIVNPDGTISHISILKGVEPSLNHEAMRIIAKMPEWVPGKHNGHKVPVRVVWPIPFRK